MLYTVLPGNYLYVNSVPYIQIIFRSWEDISSKHFVKRVQRALKGVYPYAVSTLNIYTEREETDLEVIISYEKKLCPDKKYLKLSCRKYLLTPISKTTLGKTYKFLSKPGTMVLFIYLDEDREGCLDIININNIRSTL